ncbi:MAG: hypothetical protein ACLGIW_00490 [Gammaproteobacteria bacterium]
MKILIPLVLSFAASSALAHGTHDDAPMVPLKPGARMQEQSVPPPAESGKAEAAKPAKEKAKKKAAPQTATEPAADSAAPKP